MEDTENHRIEFFEKIRLSLTEVGELDIWTELDYKNDLLSSAGVMDSLAKQTILWYQQDNPKSIERLLSLLERGYEKYSEKIMCYVYTDFLPVIVTSTSIEARDFIKSNFGRNLQKHYEQLIILGFYSELN